jgi:hypothetical protein
VADALEEKPRFVPTPTCVNIVTAWNDARLRAARAPSGGLEIDILKRGPTFFEVKREFVRLFLPEKHPRDWCSRKELSEVKHNLLPSRQAIEKTLKRLKLPLRGDRVGAPKKSQPK